MYSLPVAHNHHEHISASFYTTFNHLMLCWVCKFRSRVGMFAFVKSTDCWLWGKNALYLRRRCQHTHRVRVLSDMLMFAEAQKLNDRSLSLKWPVDPCSFLMEATGDDAAAPDIH